jgi:hypothetical protein
MAPTGETGRGIPTAQHRVPGADDRHKWVALANTTEAVFMSSLDGQRWWEPSGVEAVLGDMGRLEFVLL